MCKQRINGLQNKSNSSNKETVAVEAMVVVATVPNTLKREKLSLCVLSFTVEIKNNNNNGNNSTNASRCLHLIIICCYVSFFFAFCLLLCYLRLLFFCSVQVFVFWLSKCKQNNSLTLLMRFVVKIKRCIWFGLEHSVALGELQMTVGY